MKVGDLVTVVESNTGPRPQRLIGQSGIIISEVLNRKPEEDMFVILTRDQIIQLQRCYLEVIDENR